MKRACEANLKRASEAVLESRILEDTGPESKWSSCGRRQKSFGKMDVLAVMVMQSSGNELCECASTEAEASKTRDKKISNSIRVNKAIDEKENQDSPTEKLHA